MSKVTVQHGQTIFDIAIQVYGSVEGVFPLMADNPAINLDTDLAAGQVLLVNQVATNAQVLKYFNDNKIVPASGNAVALKGSFNHSFNTSFQTLNYLIP